MSDKNCFFFPSSSLKNGFVTKAMKRFFASNNKNIFQFFYQSFQHVFGITDDLKENGIEYNVNEESIESETDHINFTD